MIRQQPVQVREEGEKFSGIVRLITYHNPENGYSVLKVTPEKGGGREDVTVIVNSARAFAGATMDFYGKWISHPKFGQQFSANKAIEKKPATLAGIERYIGSGLMKGIGPAIAARIVKKFGDQTLDVLDERIEELITVQGISKNKLEVIKNCWTEHKKIRDVMIFLQQYNISTLFAVKIYRQYGDKAVEIVSDNPYRLAEDIYGIGFLSADRVAREMGIGVSDPRRIIACIDHVVQGARDEGHCFLVSEQIVSKIGEIMEEPTKEEIQECLEKMEKEARLLTRELPKELAPLLRSTNEQEEVKCYYAPSVYRDEKSIAERILQVSGQPLKFDKIAVIAKLREWLKKYYERYSVSLSDEQEESVLEVFCSRVAVLTGGPGCGKTTTTRVLVDMLRSSGRKILLAAPTGRAAQRMSEVIGLGSKTLHRLLEFNPAEGGFKKNLNNRLDCDFLIIDECSMLDVHLAAAILRALPDNGQILLIGDIDQLPSVGAGNVLRDIINSGKVQVCRLTKIFRQAQESSIIRFAHQINRGETPKIPTPFKHPYLWEKKADCMFIDSDEATQEQMRFIRKVKKHFESSQEIKEWEEEAVLGEEEKGLFQETELVVPEKFQFVDIDSLLGAENKADELKTVLKKVHPYSTVHYGITASNMIIKLFTETVPKYMGKTDIQVLAPMTKGTLGSIRLNQMIQQAVNPKKHENDPELTIGTKVYRIGDKVIQKVNNYTLNVFNGDIGHILSIDSQSIKATVEYPSVGIVEYEQGYLTEIDLAYAITIHKSQGSEFPVVVIPLASQHYTMLQRNLIYTGLTRAKKMAIFVGSRYALRQAVNRLESGTRQTTLSYLLSGKR
jgi:exodeoxyribonuclease V alpha subunit